MLMLVSKYVQAKFESSSTVIIKFVVLNFVIMQGFNDS